VNIFVVGVNHRTTPVHIRGKFAIGAGQLGEALSSLHNYVSQGMILCTCNRTEVYLLANDGDPDLASGMDFLNSRANLPREEFKKYVYAFEGEAAVRHLMQVASGLDSMITGEYEILGQVRRALEAAERSSLVRFPLLELFRSAVKAGRRVRTETGISRNALSVSSAAVGLAARAVGDFRGCRVVVVGAGEAGKLVAKSCREKGARDIVVASRSEEKGAALASALHGRWAPMSGLRGELTTADLVISCTGAPHTVLKFDLVKEVMEDRPGRRLVIIDIAVPPDVDGRARELENVLLFDIDVLSEVCQYNRRERQKETRQARKIIDEETRKFMSFWESLGIRPVIKDIVTKAEKIRQGQLSQTLRKLKNLSGAERTCVDVMTKSIVQGILHDPIRCLRNNHKEQEYTRIISELFNLSERGGH